MEKGNSPLEDFTDLAVEKQAPAICFALSGKSRETVLELDIQSLNHVDGVKIIFER